MPAVPAAISQRLRAKYPSPSIDPAWLQACYDWVVEEFHLLPNQMDEMFNNVEAQLLASDLRDSMVAQTGLPANVGQMEKGRIATAQGRSILCQIMAITEIGSSAFSLQNVRQTRIDKADMAGLAQQQEEEDDGEDYTIPKYPRSMLRFILSDGSVLLNAFEYRRLPGLELGVTPLGMKMVLKNVLIRNGLAFLELACASLIPNSRADELEANQEADFARGLRLRMGRPEVDQDDEVGQPPQQPPAPPLGPAPPVQAPAPAVHHEAPAPAPNVHHQYIEQDDDERINITDDSTDFGDFDFDDEVLESLEALDRAPPAQQYPQEEIILVEDSDVEEEDIAPPSAQRRRVSPEVIELSD